MRELLLDMDASAFEHLVKRLLEEMDYQDVEVTSPSNDGGVDVIARIELGITSVREVVQAKRHKRTIQRKDLDALRGSLYRFNAVRGTLVATSRFSKGTEEAAFAGGAAPITLIDGDKLIDLLIEHRHRRPQTHPRSARCRPGCVRRGGWRRIDVPVPRTVAAPRPARVNQGRWGNFPFCRSS